MLVLADSPGVWAGDMIPTTGTLGIAPGTVHGTVPGMEATGAAIITGIMMATMVMAVTTVLTTTITGVTIIPVTVAIHHTARYITGTAIVVAPTPPVVHPETQAQLQVITV
jgi:hypothetical protein